jgi:hypothetical protein
MTAVDALLEAANRLAVLPQHCYLHQARPGETLAGMPEPLRAALARLTSDDARSIRLDAVEVVVAICGLNAAWARDHRDRHRK